MRKVTFPLLIDDTTGAIIYPDDINLFFSTNVMDGNVVGMYSGELPLDDYVKPQSAIPVFVLECETNTVSLGDKFKLTASTKDNDNIVQVSGLYHAPIIRESNNTQLEFITIELVDGIGEIELDISEKGSFIIRTADIRPLPVLASTDALRLLVT